MMRGKSTITKKKYSYSTTLGLKSFRKSPYPRKRGMSEQDPNSNGDIVKDFQSTGRTGRRNALADVLGAHKDVSTSDLPLKLEKLSTKDVSSSEDSTSKQSNCINDKETESNLATNSSS